MPNSRPPTISVLAIRKAGQPRRHDAEHAAAEPGAALGRCRRQGDQQPGHGAHRDDDAGELAEQEGRDQQEAERLERPDLPHVDPRQHPCDDDREEEAVVVRRGIGELHEAERGQRHRADRGDDHTARLEQPEDQHRLHHAKQHDRIAQADEVDAEQAEGERVDEVDVTGVHVLHVAVQHVALQDALRDIGVGALVGAPPEAVVEQEQEQRRGGEGHGERGRAPPVGDDACL